MRLKCVSTAARISASLANASRAKVIFGDDLPDNITKTNADMHEVHTVHVRENIDGQPSSGGCGIVESDAQAGWAPFPE